MVTFRLSAAEYDAAVNSCRAQGYRSMSLYARAALLALESSTTSSNPQLTHMAEIRERLESLSSEIQTLTAALGAPYGGSAPLEMQSDRQNFVPTDTDGDQGQHANGLISFARATAAAETTAPAALHSVTRE